MSALANFQNDDFQSLTIWRDNSGREYYRAIDVCSNLRHSNPNQALARHVDSEYLIKLDDGTNRGGLTNYLSEPGLYQLIFASKTEWAKKFQRWVFEDVLPKLRAEGGYIAPTATLPQLQALQTDIDLRIEEASRLFVGADSWRRNQLNDRILRLNKERTKQQMDAEIDRRYEEQRQQASKHWDLLLKLIKSIKGDGEISIEDFCKTLIYLDARDDSVYAAKLWFRRHYLTAHANCKIKPFFEFLEIGQDILDTEYKLVSNQVQLPVTGETVVVLSIALRASVSSTLKVC